MPIKNLSLAVARQTDSQLILIPFASLSLPLLQIKFQQSSEHSLFSNSVVDVFTQLTQCFDVISKLETPDPEIVKRYNKRFAKTIVKVLTTYSEILKKEFPNYVNQETTVSGIIIFVFTFTLDQSWPGWTFACEIRGRSKKYTRSARRLRQRKRLRR